MGTSSSTLTATSNGEQAAEQVKPAPLFYCSFCCKSSREVAILIAGPTAFICEGCVFQCMEVISENYRKAFVSVVVSLSHSDDRVQDGDTGTGA